MNYRIGIDIGSTTAKLVLIDEDKRLRWSCYERHNARVKELLLDLLQQMADKVEADAAVQVCVTGSIGMHLAELLQAPFVQEVVAATTWVRSQYPHAKAMIDIGGEDSKVVFLDGPSPDLRMNGNCAGGTGAFIDQMAALLGITHQQMEDEASASTHLHTIAARCGVFAKTDVQNLVASGATRADICASIFHAIAVQTLTTLARGCTLTPPVLLCGGPLTFLPSLRQAFADYLKMDAERDFILPAESHLIPAMGCTLSCNGPLVTLSQLTERLKQPQQQAMSSSSNSPLFSSEEEWLEWQDSKQHYDVPMVPMQSGRQPIVLGIDSGSTTTKVIAARPDGAIVFCHYAPNHGQPIQAVSEGLKQLMTEAARHSAELEVVGSCSTGYGEQLIQRAFGLDHGIVETMAHYKAAHRLMPDVSFILDIGGQDMKAIFVKQGVVSRMELNEACSSGCGSFLQTFAQSLGYSIGDFAHLACLAEHPCDLGTRCTVFMNSKVKQVLREGAGIADIAAGLAYSVVQNCLYKVLKLKSVDELGQQIVVQGGTMRNDAVVRALERLCGHSVVRSNIPEMMGAYGCALHAAAFPSKGSRSVESLIALSDYKTRLIHCHGCANRCHVVQYTFASGTHSYSGNKCERIFSSGSSCKPGENLSEEKCRMLFEREDSCNTGRVIGIPRIFNMYEEYPFWYRLLTDCGFSVKLSSPSSMANYEQALCTVMSDNICFPAKLVHSHIAELQQAGVERILMPYVLHEKPDCPSAVNSYNCPIVSGYSDVVRSAMRPDLPIDSPVVSFRSLQTAQRTVSAYLSRLGVSNATIKAAFRNAWYAQKGIEGRLKLRAREILHNDRREHRLTILLAGRPYHTDPLIQHQLSRTIAAMGVGVITEDAVRSSSELKDGDTNTVRQWVFPNRIIKAAQWVAQLADDVQMVMITSFGCGPDAFIQDEVRSLLARHGKSLTLLKVDDIDNIGSLRLRVRSLIESLAAAQATGTCSVNQALPQGDLSLRPEGTERSEVQPFLTTRTFQRSDAGRTLLVPHISEFITPLLPAIGWRAGYHLEVLPPSDSESARIGLQYANNEVCYPATLIVGDIIRALQSGNYDLGEVAVVMSQTGGQCRATNYAGLIKRAMVQAGFADVPLVTLGVTTQSGETNQQQGFDFPWLRLAPTILNALLYADTIAKCYYAAVGREAPSLTGSAEGEVSAHLRDSWLARGADVIRSGQSVSLVQLAAQAAAEFDQITAEGHLPTVGVVGEIFLKFNHHAHQDVVGWLQGQGVEVVPPIITPFFLQEFVNIASNHKLGLTSSWLQPRIAKMIYSLVKRQIAKYNQAASCFRYFRPFTDIHEQASFTTDIVSPAAQFGEGWLLPAEVIEMARQGVGGVISLQPFGCIANHIVAKGIERSLTRRYPDLHFLSLDFDSGVSHVNVTNRLLLFLDGIKNADAEINFNNKHKEL